MVYGTDKSTSYSWTNRNVYWQIKYISDNYYFPLRLCLGITTKSWQPSKNTVINEGKTIVRHIPDLFKTVECEKT